LNHLLRKIIDAPGTGKTRLLFEALWRNWGFYFTARDTCLPGQTGDDFIGSSDFTNMIDSVKDSCPFNEDLWSKPSWIVARAENYYDNVAVRRSAEVLVARMIVFLAFLEEAEKLVALSGRSIDEYRGHWLYLQLGPEKILGEDIFDLLAQDLRGASTHFLGIDFAGELAVLNDRIQSKIGRLSIIVDEAHVLATSLSAAFVSEESIGQCRPILRQIIVRFQRFENQVVLSGSGINLTDKSEIQASNFLKPGWVTHKDIGEIDSKKAQARYMASYLPKWFVESETGKEFFNRVWKWLYGR
jgi:hypothetical protein